MQKKEFVPHKFRNALIISEVVQCCQSRRVETGYIFSVSRILFNNVNFKWIDIDELKHVIH